MIDYFWHVPAGDRNSNNWRKYRRGDKDIPMGLVGVYFSHGGPFAIDELFYFDDELDAKWFLAEGFRGMLLHSNDGVKEDAPDRLFIFSATTDIVAPPEMTF
jgi:hypothetical protein